jgi:hypothetical protein
MDRALSKRHRDASSDTQARPNRKVGPSANLRQFIEVYRRNGVVVMIARTRISRRVTTLVDVISIVVAIMVIAACKSHGCTLASSH